MYKCKNQQVWWMWGAVGATLASECCHSGYVYSVRQLHVIYSVLKALEGPGVQDREANTEIFSSNKIRRDEILILTRSDLSGTVNPAQPQALINVFCSNAE